MIYDYVILGGGISGLYAADLILQKNSRASVLLLEKEDSFGGRVFTYHDRHFKSIEAGAGRFIPRLHPLLSGLIRDMHLDHLVHHFSGSSHYYPALDPEQKQRQRQRQDHKIKQIWDRLFDASKHVSPEQLRSMTVLEFAQNIVGTSDTQLLQDSFGYYSELVVMNAADAFHLIRTLHHPVGGFAGLAGGFSAVIDGLIDRLQKHKQKHKETANVMLKRFCQVLRVDTHADGSMYTIQFQSTKTNKITDVVARTCICALPMPVLQQIFALANTNINANIIRSLLKTVSCQPLCRIYAKYEVNSGSPVWFSGLKKFTTNNDLRMVIPLDEKEGTIMISYSDHRFADAWQRLYLKGGVEAVEKKCVRLIRQVLGRDLHVPACKAMRVFYWDCGVGYWKVGADSKAVSSALLQPLPRLFICGENFSYRHQQWMEGALETAKRAVELSFV